MTRRHRLRLATALLITVGVSVFTYFETSQTSVDIFSSPQQSEQAKTSLHELESLEVKGRAPKTGYARTQFGNGWTSILGCDTRNTILARDLKDAKSDDCKVLSGLLNDPYTDKRIMFQRGADTSDDVQIDHVVALSNAWQTGAQQLTPERRIEFANDPLNLLAVDGNANQKKADGDAATWLPANKTFRCQYVSRQIKVKHTYKLWVTLAEKQKMKEILSSCGH